MSNAVGRDTKSLIFLLHFLGRHQNYYGKSLYNLFINIDKYKQLVLVFSKPLMNDKNYQEIFSELELSKDFANRDDTENYIIYKFYVPEEYEKDFDMFVEGKYSKISQESKKKIISGAISNREVNKLEEILYPKATHRIALGIRLGGEIPEDAEVFSIPDMKKELFNPENYYDSR